MRLAPPPRCSSSAPSSRRPVACRNTSSSDGRDDRDRADPDLARHRGGARSRRSSRRRPRGRGRAHRVSVTTRSSPAARRPRASVAAASAPSSATVTTSWPICALSSSGVPSATIRPASMIATPVAELVGLLEVLGRQEDGRARGVDPANLVPDRQPRGRVEAGRRLVEEQHLGRVDQCAREVEPPLHAARVRLRPPIGGVGEPDELEQLLGPRVGVRGRDPVQAALQLEQLAPGLHGVEPDLLERDADPPAHRGGIGDDVDAGDSRRCRWSAAAACTASGPWSSCRRRWGRGTRRPRPRRRRGRCRGRPRCRP